MSIKKILLREYALIDVENKITDFFSKSLEWQVEKETFN